MTEKEQPADFKSLRKKAEQKLHYEDIPIHKITKDEALKAIHELHVHQVELEMQNHELQEAQAELEQSRSKYTDLYDFAPIGYFVLDKKGIISEVNLTGTSLVGIERNKLLRQSFTRCVSKEDQDVFYLNRREVFENKISKRCDLKILRKGKEAFFAELLMVPVMESYGRVTSCRVAVVDITRRKQAEDRLVLHAQIFDQVHDAVVSTDLDGMITGWNNGACTLFGYSAEEALGRHICLVQPPDGDHFLQKQVIEPLKKNGFHDLELVQRRKSGDLFYAHLSLSLIRNKKDQAIGMIGYAIDISKRKQAEEQVNNIAKFPAENPFPVLRVAEDGTVIYSNAPGEVLLKEWNCQVGQTVPPYWQELMEQVLKSNTCLMEEIQCGGEFFSIAIAPVQEERYVNLYGRDVTQLRLAEEALQKAHDSLEQQVRERTIELHEANRNLSSQAELLELAHDMIFVHDLHGKIIFWNQGAEKTLGWKKEEILGKSVHGVLRTQFSEPLMNIIASVSTRGRWEGELVHKAKDGRQIVVESRWAMQRDETGKASAILEIDRDISDRKAAEQKIQEARKYAESIIETIHEALVVLNADLKVVSANKTFYQLFRLRPEETEGQAIYTLNPNHWDMPGLRKRLEEILPQNTNLEDFEMLYVPPKDSVKVLLLNGRRIYQERKQTELILLAIQDITLRKQQERIIRDLTEELLLAEEEQRQQIATTLHDSIGQMLAFSKRELSSLLQDPGLKEDIRLKKVLNELSKSVKQSRALTADLSSPTLHTFGLEAAIEELAEQFSEENGFSCSLNITAEDTPLEKKIQLLLYRSVKELLCNISKHAGAKQVNIDLAASGNFLEVTITDNGKGFDASDFNTNSHTKKTFGLFSIQQRLTNVGGSFFIESKKNKGTKVILQAPLKKTENQREP